MTQFVEKKVVCTFSDSRYKYIKNDVRTVRRIHLLVAFLNHQQYIISGTINLFPNDEVNRLLMSADDGFRKKRFKN